MVTRFCINSMNASARPFTFRPPRTVGMENLPTLQGFLFLFFTQLHYLVSVLYFDYFISVCLSRVLWQEQDPDAEYVVDRRRAQRTGVRASHFSFPARRAPGPAAHSIFLLVMVCKMELNIFHLTIFSQACDGAGRLRTGRHAVRGSRQETAGSCAAGIWCYSKHNQV